MEAEPPTASRVGAASPAVAVEQSTWESASDGLSTERPTVSPSHPLPFFLDSLQSPKLVTPEEPRGAPPPVRNAASVSPGQAGPSTFAETGRTTSPLGAFVPAFFGATRSAPFTQPALLRPKARMLEYDSEASSIDVQSRKGKTVLRIPRSRHTRDRLLRQQQTSHIGSGAMSDSAAHAEHAEPSQPSQPLLPRLTPLRHLETQSTSELPVQPTVAVQPGVQLHAPLDTVAEESEGESRAEETDPWTPMQIDLRSGDLQRPSWPHLIPEHQHMPSPGVYQPASYPTPAPPQPAQPSQASQPMHASQPRPMFLTATAAAMVPGARMVPVTPLPPVSPVHPLSRGLVDPSLPTTRSVTMPSVKACHNFLLALKVHAAKRAAAVRDHNRRVFEQAQREGMALCVTPGVVVGVKPTAYRVTNTQGTAAAPTNIWTRAGTTGQPQYTLQPQPAQGVHLQARSQVFVHTPAATIPTQAQGPTTHTHPRFPSAPQLNNTAQSSLGEHIAAPALLRRASANEAAGPSTAVHRRMQALNTRHRQLTPPSEASVDVRAERQRIWLTEDRRRAHRIAMAAARVEAQARAGMAGWETSESEEEEDVESTPKRRRL